MRNRNVLAILIFLSAICVIVMLLGRLGDDQDPSTEVAKQGREDAASAGAGAKTPDREGQRTAPSQLKTPWQQDLEWTASPIKLIRLHSKPNNFPEGHYDSPLASQFGYHTRKLGGEIEITNQKGISWKVPETWGIGSRVISNPDGSILRLDLWTKSQKSREQYVVFLEAENLTEIDRVDFRGIVPGWEYAETVWLDVQRVACLYGRPWHPGEAPSNWSGAEKEADPYAETLVLIYDIRAGKFVPVANGSDALPRRIESISGRGNCFCVVDKDLLGQGPEINTIWFKVTEE